MEGEVAVEAVADIIVQDLSGGLHCTVMEKAQAMRLPIPPPPFSDRVRGTCPPRTDRA